MFAAFGLIYFVFSVLLMLVKLMVVAFILAVKIIFSILVLIITFIGSLFGIRRRRRYQ